LTAWAPVSGLLRQATGAGILPGCALHVRASSQTLHAERHGVAELRPRQRPVLEDTPFDLASLTKVLATTPLLMTLHDTLSPDTPVRAVLPDGPEGVTIGQCLQHSSGLPAWRPFYADVLDRTWGSAQTRAAVLRSARTTPLEAPPGARHAYSDLGFLTLGAAIEAVCGDRLDRAWERRVRAPSGVDLRWGWPDAAATEDCPIRERVVVGEVHDLNAAVLGGIAPHAGLFGSAAAVAAAAAWQLRAWRGEAGEGLDPGVVRQFWSDKGAGSHRLGWDGVTPGASSAGPRWPLDGVGHLAFTGCSIWIAPRQDIVVVWLSNRVHPEIEGGAVPDAPVAERYAAYRRLRPRLHTAVVDALERIGRWS